MSGLLEGKVAFVTGGDRGIGAEICKAFIREGISVLGVGYRCDRISMTTFIPAIAEIARRNSGVDHTKSISELGQSWFAIEADMSTPSGRQHLFRGMDAELRYLTGDNKIDIAVNAAGLVKDVNAGNTLPDWQPVTAKEFSEILACITAEEIERLRDGGRIINLTNRLEVPENEFAAAADENTARAIWNLTATLAKQLAPRQITVNSISPGPEGAAIGAWVQMPDCNRQVDALPAVSRLGSPQGVAEAVLEPASPRCRWITGGNVWSKTRQKWAVPK